MLGTVLRILICALGGVGAALLAGLWIHHLESCRGLKGDLSDKSRRIAYAVMAVCGGAGALSKGLFAPICALVFLGICYTAAVMDFQHRIIPNETVLCLIGLKLLSGLASLLGFEQLIAFDIVQSLLGLAVCFAVFILPGFFGKNVGAGDVKLAAAMGFFLGLRFSLLGIMLMGLAVIAYTLFQRKLPFVSFLKTTIPMGPFIAVGMYLVLIGAPFLR